jgi:hypothetical protein
LGADVCWRSMASAVAVESKGCIDSLHES